MFSQSTIQRFLVREEPGVYYLCYLHTRTKGRKEFGDSELTQVLGERMKCGPWSRGPWRVFEGIVNNDTRYPVAVYGRKVVVCHIIPRKEAELYEILNRFREIDKSLPECLERELRRIEGVRRVVHYPVIVVDRFRVSEECIPRANERILRFFDEYLTTFTFRIFDPDEVRVGYLRASVHQMVCLGLGKRIVQEIVGLVYEKLLYPWILESERKRSPHGRHHATPSDLFDFFDALKNYTLSTELSVFAAVFSSRLAVYLGLVAVLVTSAVSLVPAFGFLTVLGISSLVVLFGTWVLLRKYLRIHDFL